AHQPRAADGGRHRRGPGDEPGRRRGQVDDRRQPRRRPGPDRGRDADRRRRPAPAHPARDLQRQQRPRGLQPADRRGRDQSPPRLDPVREPDRAAERPAAAELDRDAARARPLAGRDAAQDRRLRAGRLAAAPAGLRRPHPRRPLRPRDPHRRRQQGEAEHPAQRDRVAAVLRRGDPRRRPQSGDGGPRGLRLLPPDPFEEPTAAADGQHLELMSLRRFGGGDIVAVALLVSLAMAYGAVHSPLVAIGLLFAIVFAGWVVMRPDLVLLVVVAALPWQDKLQYPNATLSLVKLLGLALVAAYFLRAVRQNEVVRLPPVLGFALAFGLVIGLALIASPEPSAGLEKAFRYVFFILFLFLMIQMIDTRAQATRLLRVLVASCAAAALYGIVGFVSGTVERASGPIADPNDFAYMMAAVIPFALFLCVEDRRWRLVWVTSTLLLLGATCATRSRGAIAGLAALRR